MLPFSCSHRAIDLEEIDPPYVRVEDPLFVVGELGNSLWVCYFIGNVYGAEVIP